MDLNLSAPQGEFMTSVCEYTAAVAGFGSGKTMAAIAKIISLKLKYPDIDQAYYAPTYKLIKKIFYPELVQLLEAMSIKFGIHYTDNEVSMQGMGKIICGTMGEPDKIVGYQVGDAVMDELDLLPKDKAISVVRKVSARCRQKYPDGKMNQKWVTTTPEGYKGVWQMFKKEPLPNSKIIQMSTWSNFENLPAGYIESRMAQYPPELVKAYIDGEFVNLTSGKVYYAYDRDVCDTHYVVKPREAVHIGMDFNVYHMCAIVHIIRDNILYAVDEIVDLRDTPDMIEVIKSRYKDHSVTIYPDATGSANESNNASQSDHVLLQSAGFFLRNDNTNPLIKDRLLSMNTAFAKGKLFVNQTTAHHYAECLEQQVFDSNGMPDKKSGFDHAVDAGGYCTHHILPVIDHVVQAIQLGGF